MNSMATAGLQSLNPPNGSPAALSPSKLMRGSHASSSHPTRVSHGQYGTTTTSTPPPRSEWSSPQITRVTALKQKLLHNRWPVTHAQHSRKSRTACERSRSLDSMRNKPLRNGSGTSRKLNGVRQLIDDFSNSKWTQVWYLLAATQSPKHECNNPLGITPVLQQIPRRIILIRLYASGQSQDNSRKYVGSER